MIGKNVHDDSGDIWKGDPTALLKYIAVDEDLRGCDERAGARVGVLLLHCDSLEYDWTDVTIVL